MTRRAAGRCRRVVGCAGVLSLLAADAAAARPLPEGIDLDYEAGVGCPGDDVFVAALRARETAGRSPAAPPLFVHVVVQPDRAGAHGRLGVVSASGGRTEREVRGATCEQVVAALALVTALVLDGSALDAPSAAASAAPSAPPPPRLAKGGPAAARPSPDEGEITAPIGEGQWRLSLAAEAGVTGAVPPGLAFAVPAYAELRYEPARSITAWTPSVRVGFERAFGASVSVPEGTAAFDWNVARLDACASFDVASGLSLGPCAGADLGELHAASRNAGGLEASRLWLAVGVLARARWVLWRPALFVDLEAGAVLPLTRDHFSFDPQPTLYDVPVAAPRAGGGLGAYFW